MNVSYKKILNKSMLILSDFDIENFTHNYLIKMLTNNNISGLLSTELNVINLKPTLSYDITSKHSVMSVLENRKIDFKLFSSIMTGLHRLCTTLDSFMLDSCYLILSPEYIFLDGNMQLPYFCYCPVCENDHTYSFTTQLKLLLEYLISKLNYDDKNCVAHVYSLHQKCVEDTFCTDDLTASSMDIFFKNSTDNLTVSDSKNYVSDSESGSFMNNIVRDASNISLNNSFSFDNNTDSTDNTMNNTVNSFSDNTLNNVPDDIFIKDSNSSYILGFPAAYFLIFSGLICLCVFTIISGLYLYFIKKTISLTMSAVICLSGPVIFLLALPSLLKKRTKDSLPPDDSHISSVSPDTASHDYSDEDLILKNNSSYIMPIGETVLISRCNPVAVPHLLYNGNDFSEDIRLTSFPFTIGKIPDSVNHIIDNTLISRIHARFYKKEDCYYIEDLNSSNGTYVNNVPLSPHTMTEIQDGDCITFACLTYIFKLC